MDSTREFIEMSKDKEFQHLALKNLEDGEFIMWWDNRHKEIRKQIVNKNRGDLLDFESFKEDFIFLLSQDQMQKILRVTNIPIFLESFTFEVCEVNSLYYNVFYSMEQTLLAFLLKEKYNKIWNGKEWIIKHKRG